MTARDLTDSGDARYPAALVNVTNSRRALELMKSERCLESTGEHGEHCNMRRLLPLYMGDGGNFERTLCCSGNDVDCTRCGAYGVFNSRYHRSQGRAEPPPTG